ncbi:unnamed protein product [Closterium sp. NIES-53]
MALRAHPFLRGAPPPPFPPPSPLLLLQTSLFLRTSVLLRLVRSAATARARVAGVVEEAAVVVEVAMGVVVGAAVEEAEAVEVVAAVGPVAEVEAEEGVAAVEAVRPVVVGLDLSVEALVVVGASRSSVGARLRCPSSSRHCFARLDNTWRTEFGDDVERPRWAVLLRSGVAIFDLDFDVIVSAMYVLAMFHGVKEVIWLKRRATWLLSAFATVADLVTHLRTSDARYRATVPPEFLPTNQPPMFITLYFIVTRLPDSLRSVRDHFLTLDPTSLTVDLLEQHLLAAETSAVAVGAARGTLRSPFFVGCFPSLGGVA